MRTLLLILIAMMRSVEASEESNFEQGHILFALHSGDIEQGWKAYQKLAIDKGEHDYALLHQMALETLSSGWKKKDPEIQLFTLFGASITAHEEAYYILEEGLKSPYPIIQIIALKALAEFQTDRADQAIMRSLGAPILEVRVEAAQLLCKKKHTLAVGHLESLYFKTPAKYHALYPSLCAMVEDPRSTRLLQQMLNHARTDVRLSAILSIAKYKRDDLLPQLRRQALQAHHALQEAACAAFDLLKDEEALPILAKLRESQYPTVSFTANVALYHLGKEEALYSVEEKARVGDLFAIAALGCVKERSDLLIGLLSSSDEAVRLNAIIALLKQRHPKALEHIEELLIRNKHSTAFATLSSPGHTLQVWKAISSAPAVLKDDVDAFVQHIEFKETLLETVRMQSPSRFIALAHRIFSSKQNELVPKTAALLQEIESEEAARCLKQHQQQLGAPLVRHSCNLALYCLQEEGPYADRLQEWLKAEKETQMIQFKPFDPWELVADDGCALRPKEASRLMIEAYQTFAAKHDARGIDVLVEAIATGNEKNRYALCGLLLRAAQ